MTKVQFGIDAFLQSNHYPKKLRYALVTNNVATTSDGEPSRLALRSKNYVLLNMVLLQKAKMVPIKTTVLTT